MADKDSRLGIRQEVSGNADIRQLFRMARRQRATEKPITEYAIQLDAILQQTRGVMFSEVKEIFPEYVAHIATGFADEAQEQIKNFNSSLRSFWIDHLYGDLAISLTPHKLKAATRIVGSIESEPIRNSVYSRMAGTVVVKDLKLALEISDLIPHHSRDWAYFEMARVLAPHNFIAAKELADKIPKKEERNWAYSSIAIGLRPDSVHNAMQFVNSIPNQSARTFALQVIAGSLATIDFQLATDIADQISDAKYREKAYGKMAVSLVETDIDLAISIVEDMSLDNIKADVYEIIAEKIAITNPELANELVNKVTRPTLQRMDLEAVRNRKISVNNLCSLARSAKFGEIKKYLPADNDEKVRDYIGLIKELSV